MVKREVEELEEILSEQEGLYEVVTYKIIEEFGDRLLEYEVNNLRFDLEDDILWFNDNDDVILRINSCLKGIFLYSSELDKHKNYFVFKLEGGTITVKY